MPGVTQKQGEDLGRGFCQLMEFPVSSRNPDFFQVMGGNNPRKRGCSVGSDMARNGFLTELESLH